MKNLDIDKLLELSGEEPKKIDIENYLKLLKYNWKWIAVSVIVALFVAFIYLRYSTPVYRINSSIILKEKNKGFGYSATSLAGVDLTGGVNNVDNEIEVIKSKSIMKGLVNALRLHTAYTIKGRIKDNDLYANSPILITMPQDELDRLQSPVHLTVELNKDQSVAVSYFLNGKESNTTLKTLPALLKVKGGTLTLSLRSGVRPAYNVPIYVTINRPLNLVGSIQSGLTVAPASATTSVINLSYRTSNIPKGIDILNTLADVYNRDAIEDRNREASNTRDFIDERIRLIDDELSDAERNVENYKRNQRLTDLQSNTQLSLQKSSQYEQKLVELETQLKLVDYLAKYVEQKENAGKMIPGNIGVEDPTLVATIGEYNRLILEKERLMRTTTDSNPVMIDLNNRVQGLRENINSAIRTVNQGLSIARRDAQSQVNQYNSRIGVAPTQEREFTEIVRQQQIKSTLYVMLLQKREENALALASTANSAKVLDEATYGGIVSPIRTQVYMLALLLGLLIPVAFIVLREMLRYKVQNRKDVERLTNIPVLGELPVYKGNEVAVQESGNLEIDEAFRIIRTNLLYVLGGDKKVVMFTSTEPDEGKTFTAINTAISLSLLNKKVLLIGLDLRLPALKNYMGLETRNGITEYLSGFETDLNALVVRYKENLSVLPAGKIPPNPAELLSRGILDKAIGELKEQYDYILIDSTPASMVTDTLVANRVADATVYLCRADFTPKNNVKYADELSVKNRLKNMAIVVNAVNEFHQGYGYGYGYGYAYGHEKRRYKEKSKGKS